MNNRIAQFVRSRWDLVALAALACAFAALVATGSRHYSVTFDESAHVPAGLSYWRTGDFRLEGFNSPLPRLLIAAPLALDSSVRLPLGPGWQARDIWPVSHDFMRANTDRYHALFLRARLPVLVAGLIVIMLTFLLALHFGRPTAIAAAAIIAFDPNFIAHAGVATADVIATMFFLAAVIALRALARSPSQPRALQAGMLIGLAILSKFSAVILPLLLPVLLLIGSRGGRPRLARLVHLTLTTLVTAWLVICTFYLWQGVGGSMNEADFQSRSFRQWSRRLHGLPVPLPRPLLAGMDITSRLNENPEKNFALGQTYYGGRPWYFPVAYALKTPLPQILCLLLGAAFFFRRPRPWRDEWFILLPLALQAGFVAFASNWNIGVRYLLPAYPFLAAVAGCLAARPAPLTAPAPGPNQSPPKPTLRHGKPFPRLALIATFALAGATLASTIAAWPHYLSYFNAAAGGWRHGHRLLADSNLDWGQDLIYLRDWLRDHPGGSPRASATRPADGAEPICLVYFGNIDPSLYDIKYRVPADPEHCPVLAISVEHLYQFSFRLLTPQGYRLFPPGRFETLRSRTPDEIVGTTIWVFRDPRLP